LPLLIVRAACAAHARSALTAGSASYGDNGFAIAFVVVVFVGVVVGVGTGELTVGVADDDGRVELTDCAPGWDDEQAASTHPATATSPATGMHLTATPTARRHPIRSPEYDIR